MAEKHRFTKFFTSDEILCWKMILGGWSIFLLKNKYSLFVLILNGQHFHTFIFHVNQLFSLLRVQILSYHCRGGICQFFVHFFCISMYKQMEAIFVSFWYLILTTLKEICGNLRFFELIGF